MTETNLPNDPIKSQNDSADILVQDNLNTETNNQSQTSQEPNEVINYLQSVDGTTENDEPSNQQSQNQIETNENAEQLPFQNSSQDDRNDSNPEGKHAGSENKFVDYNEEEDQNLDNTNITPENSPNGDPQEEEGQNIMNNEDTANNDGDQIENNQINSTNEDTQHDYVDEKSLDNEHYHDEEDEQKVNIEVEQYDEEINDSADSADEIVDFLFNKNQSSKTPVDRRNLNSRLSVRSEQSYQYKSLKKATTSRSTTKTQKYNVTRPFQKKDISEYQNQTEEMPKPEPAEPIQYIGDSDFIQRQNESNERKIKNQSQQPTERGFDPPLYVTDPPPNKTTRPSTTPKKEQSEQTSKNTIKAPPYLEDLFRTSVKPPPSPVPDPVFEQVKIDHLSNDLAHQRRYDLVDAIIGPKKQGSLGRYITIMKNFSIPYRQRNRNECEEPVIHRIRETIQIDDNNYDLVKLKEIIYESISDDCSDPIATEIRPAILASFSNIRPTMIIPRKSPKKGKTQANRNSKSPIVSKKEDKNDNENNSSIINENSVTDDKEIYEFNETTNDENNTSEINNESTINDTKNDEDVEIIGENIKKHAKSPKQTPSKKKTPKSKRKEKKNSAIIDNNLEEDQNDLSNESNEKKTPKKSTLPKRTTPKGAKYFPGFYDNLDFYVLKKPNK